MDNILANVPSQLLNNPGLDNLLTRIKEEIEHDYHSSLRKNIVDYILKDPEEKERLFIASTPPSYPIRVIRAPVPWHTSCRDAKSWTEEHLFMVNPIMLSLQDLWHQQFAGLRFVRTKDLLTGNLPLLPAEFEKLVHNHCLEDGNDFGDIYDDMKFFIPQVLIIKLKTEEPKIAFDPILEECWNLIKRCFYKIIQSAEGIPKVEGSLFPGLQVENTNLRSVKQEESLVSEFISQTLEIFNKNFVGPQKYLNVYKKYNDLLNKKAQQDVNTFLREEHSLQAFTKPSRWPIQFDLTAKLNVVGQHLTLENADTPKCLNSKAM
ncbi:Hypothetical predicted protein [Pelobates cultripes]|uniref:Uncharacterized protein n=1 Tax=Pelobates cultripes TaxID=61616 RepID=A0AAD1WFH2_PELCU|nr:Hypothetical predicted protein [Pelobates cultripes]